MRTKQNVSVGIDGISCTVSGCSIPKETEYPIGSKNPFLKLKPRGVRTEVSVILPRTIRDNNNIGFRVSDIKQLAEVVQLVNRILKQIIGRDWSELFVTQLEVAVTVDLGIADELVINSAMNFLSNVLLRQDRPIKQSEKKNAFVTQLEVAVTVDLGIADELVINSAMNFLSNVLLRQDRPIKQSEKKNAQTHKFRFKCFKKILKHMERHIGESATIWILMQEVRKNRN